MGSFPYTDVNLTYACDEGVASSSLLDTTGVPTTLNMIPQSSPAVVADGMFDGARGVVGESVFFSRGVGEDDAYDVGGLISMTMVGWCRVASLNQSPFFWSVHNTDAANNQAWQLIANQAGGAGNQVPQFRMLDGLTIFNSLGVKASDTAPDMTVDVWHMIGGGWNKDTNKMACFWGDGNDESGNTTYYQEADGFAAGFGLTHTNGMVWAGAFRAGGDNGNFVQIDHVSYWKDRAFNEDDFQNHWQLGAGLAFADFDEQPPPICWNYSVRYKLSNKMHKQSGPGAFPKKLIVPGNVDVGTGRMVDDGRLIDTDDYEVY